MIIQQKLDLLMLSFLLGLYKVIDSKLSPYKVNLRCDFISELPPKSSSHDSLDDGWVISFSDKELVRPFNIIRESNVQSIRIVDFPEPILIKAKFNQNRVLCLLFIWWVPHAEDKVVFSVQRDSLCWDVWLYFY